MIYYISDMHFRHKNILHLSRRPFETVEDMDSFMITEWNKKVQKTDTVYILGDIGLGSAKSICTILCQLNGVKHLIVGNHDKAYLKSKEFCNCFSSISDIGHVRDNGVRIVMCHYPLVEWDGYFRGTVLLYGHIHNNTVNFAYSIMSKIENSYNVGADILNFVPCTFEEIKQCNANFITSTKEEK